MGFARRLTELLSAPLGIHIVRKGASWELVELDQLSQFLARFNVDCVFDVGANEGQYALRLRKMGFKGQIFSFEPNPHLVPLLEKLSARDQSWRILPFALDETERLAPFNVTQNSEFGSLHKARADLIDQLVDLAKVVESPTVQTRTLKGVFDELKLDHNFKRPFLKMDTQGHDLAVARGAGPVLQAFVGLQSELSFTTIYQDSPGYREALDYYSENGFSLTALVPNNGGHFPDLLEMDCIMHNARMRGVV